MSANGRWLPVVVLVASAVAHGPSASAAPGEIHTIAGGNAGDGGPALEAGLDSPTSIALDPAGHLYIVDTPLHGRLRVVDLGTATITSVAGDGNSEGSSPDGTCAADARFHGFGVAADPRTHDVYYTEYQTVRTVARHPDGCSTVETLAGTGTDPYTEIYTHTAVGTDGAVYFNDYQHRQVKKVLNGVVSVVAGSGQPGCCGDYGDGGPALEARFATLMGVAVDAEGNVFVSDGNVHRVDHATGIMTLVAELRSSLGIDVDASGNVYAAVRGDEPAGFVYRIAPGGQQTRIAGYPFFLADRVEGQSASLAYLEGPIDVALDDTGNVFVVERWAGRVSRIDASGAIWTVVGRRSFCSASGDGGPAVQASLCQPQGVAAGAGGEVFVADAGNLRIRRIDAAGRIETVAGNGRAATATAYFNPVDIRVPLGDGGPATEAELCPKDVATDHKGNLFIADGCHHRVRKVDRSGVITTVAGNGVMGYSGDGVPAVAASLAWPWAVEVNDAGDVFIADAVNGRIRRVDGRSGLITTVAGTGRCGPSGARGPSTAADLCAPASLALGGDGSLYVGEVGSYNRVRRVDPGGTIETVAGNGCNGPVDGCPFADDAPATSVALANPYGLAVDTAGNVYIAEDEWFRVRRVASGIIRTVAGGGFDGASTGPHFGDGGPATEAYLRVPMGLALDAAGDLFVADMMNGRLRVVERPQP